ncbi:MAG: PilZ domain-containing protein [Gaiellales bacterium]
MVKVGNRCADSSAYPRDGGAMLEEDGSSVDAVACYEVAAGMVADRVVQVGLERGGLIEVSVLRHQDGKLVGRVRRDGVATASTLVCRRLITGIPHLVCIHVDEVVRCADGHDELLLRVISAQPDPQHRLSDRHALAVGASLTAVRCHQVMEGERIPVHVVDLSARGVGVTTTNPRVLVYDEFRFECRVFEGNVECDVQIVRVVTDWPRPSTNLVGCAFANLTPETRGILSRVADRLEHPPTSSGQPSIRALLGIT